MPNQNLPNSTTSQNEPAQPSSPVVEETVSDLTTPPVGFKLWVIVFVNIQSLLFSAAIIWVAYRINPEMFHLNILICLLGALIGWLVGTLVSPYTTAESTRFLTLSQAISAFISGFLVSKLDRFLEATLYKDGGITQDNSWERVGLFATSFLVMTIIVYINRTYFQTIRTS